MLKGLVNYAVLLPVGLSVFATGHNFQSIYENMEMNILSNGLTSRVDHEPLQRLRRQITMKQSGYTKLAF